jgi:hypothetical protein
VKQELSTTLGERQVAQFIEHDQIMPAQVFHQSSAPVIELLLFQSGSPGRARCKTWLSCHF